MAEPSPAARRRRPRQAGPPVQRPLSFYRELIQNSLDAGSEEVEISLTYEASESGGVAQLQVQTGAAA
jgi:DNA mismatch repair ATPase MutL